MRIIRIEITASHLADGDEAPRVFSFGPHLCQTDLFRAPLVRFAREVIQTILPCFAISTDGEDRT